MLRICPMRDGVCPHGMDCPYVGEGRYGYPCKDGWRGRALECNARAQLEQRHHVTNVNETGAIAGTDSD